MAANSSWKTVRVFVSSTFHDMHAERDYLAKVCFPRLRQWCEEHRLHFVDVDLRWGITREEAESGKAVEICLHQIDECRPLFVCLLGERYGSVTSAEANLLAGVDPAEPHSITHLEILHAAFNARLPEAPCEPFFYFRDPAALPRPEALNAEAPVRQAYATTYFQPQPAPGEPDLRERLSVLKERISDSFGPAGRVRRYRAHWDSNIRNQTIPFVPGQLAGLEGFGQRVETDLRSAIEARFPDHLSRPDEPLGPAQQEQVLQDDFIASRIQIHAPDLQLQNSIDVYMAGEKNSPCCLLGPAGSGKSASLCYWMAHRVRPEDRSWLGNAASLVLFRAVGASPTCSRLSDLLAGVWVELSARLAYVAVLPMLPRDPSDVVRGWPSLLSAAAAVTTGRLIIILDGLDQLEDAAIADFSWIPRILPSQVRLLISVAGDPTCTLDTERWKALRERDVITMAVPPLDEKRSRLIIRDLPSLYAKSLDERQRNKLLSNAASRNPLFLTVALRELRLFGSFERLDDAVAGLPRPAPGEALDGVLHRLFNVILARLEEDQPQTLRPIVEMILGALAASRRGLTEVDLSGLLARNHHEVPAEVRDATLQVVLRQLRPYMLRRQAAGRMVLGFFHRSLNEAVCLRYLSQSEQQSRRREQIAIYFEAQPWFNEKGKPNRGKVVELPWLRLQILRDRYCSVAADRLAALLFEWDLLDAKYRAGLLYELADDLHEGQELLGRDRAESMRLSLVEEALRRDIGFIDSHRFDYPQALLQCLWNNCWWYDHPSARWHYAGNVRGEGFEGELAGWVEACRRKAAHREPNQLWLRQKRPPFKRLGAGLQLRLTGFSRAVTQLAWSVDARLLFAVSSEPAVRVFNAQTGQELYQLPHVGGYAKSIAVSPDGRRFALGLSASVTHETVKEFTLSGEHLATHIAHRSSVHRLAYSHDGRFLIAASHDGSVSVWTVNDGALLQRIGTPVPQRKATALAVDFDLVPGTTQLVLCRREPEFQIWDWKSGRELSRWRSRSIIDNVRVCPKGKFVASHSGYSGSSGLWIYDIRHGQVVAHMNCGNDMGGYDIGRGRVVARIDRGNDFGGPIAWSPEGSAIAIAHGKTHRIRIFRVTDRKCIMESGMHLSKVNALAFSPEGDRLASAAGDPLSHLDLSTEDEYEVHVVTPLQVGKEVVVANHKKEVSALAYSADGKQIVSISRQQTLEYENEARPVRLWDAATLLQAGGRFVDESIETFQVVPGGMYAITSGRCHQFDEGEASAVRIWKWPEMQSVWVGRFAGWAGVMLPPNGKEFWLRCGSKLGTLDCAQYDVPSGRRARDLPVVAIAFSPDGSLVVEAGSSSSLTVRDSGTLQIRLELPIEVRLERATFSPDMSRLVHTDGYAIVIREWPSGLELHRLRGHPSAIKALYVSADGMWVTSVANDLTRVWDLGSGHCIREFAGRLDVGPWSEAPFAGGLWPASTEGELRIIQSADGRAIAYAPGSWHKLCSHPSGRCWAGAQQRHLASWELVTLVEAEAVHQIDPPANGCEAQPLVMSAFHPWKRLKRWFESFRDWYLPL